MNIFIIFALTSAPTALPPSDLGPLVGTANFFALAFALAVAIWTFLQNSRPRRFIELPSAQVEPEFDGRGDEPAGRREYRDAA